MEAAGIWSELRMLYVVSVCFDREKLVWTLQVSGQNFACSILYQSVLIGGKNQNTQEIKRTLFNNTEQDKTCKFLM